MTPQEAIDVLKDMYSMECAEAEAMQALDNLLYHADQLVIVWRDENFGPDEKKAVLDNLDTAVNSKFNKPVGEKP